LFSANPRPQARSPEDADGARLRASASEASRLAGLAGSLLLSARTGTPSWTGSHGRRRAGPGETFWQFRDHRAEDGARAVDWRRSARGDRLFVRDLEHTGAARLRFWLDTGPGFDWSSDAKLPTKRLRAGVIMTAVGQAAASSGERIDIDGNPAPPSRAGAGPLLERMLLAGAAEGPSAPRFPAAATVIASDFYAPIEAWRERLLPHAASGGGVLLAVIDPAEELFPFSGRTMFEDPRGQLAATLLGRAEAALQSYKNRFAAHRAALVELSRSLGWAFIAHRTDHHPGQTVVALASHLSQDQGGGRARWR
jgi:uncharacterized protein (DUF58 family)